MFSSVYLIEMFKIWVYTSMAKTLNEGFLKIAKIYHFPDKT